METTETTHEQDRLAVEQIAASREKIEQELGRVIIGQKAAFVYFSMITMTTVGYGEITPAASLPRMMTGMQAIVGTMFVAIFIGRIVGRLK